MKTQSKKKGPLQLRIGGDQERGAEIVSKLEKIAAVNGLSINDVANMAVAAGLGMVERKLEEIHKPVSAQAA